MSLKNRLLKMVDSGNAELGIKAHQIGSKVFRVSDDNKRLSIFGGIQKQNEKFIMGRKLRGLLLKYCCKEFL